MVSKKDGSIHCCPENDGVKIQILEVCNFEIFKMNHGMGEMQEKTAIQKNAPFFSFIITTSLIHHFELQKQDSLIKCYHLILWQTILAKTIHSEYKREIQES